MNLLKDELDKFFKSLKTYNFSKNEIGKIIKAWDFAKLKHGNQIRKSGEPYIIHPLLTAKYLLTWKMDSDTIIAGILHDVLEDTNTSEEELKNLFGDDVLSIVVGVTKVSIVSGENRLKDKTKAHESNESIIKILLSISSDIRIIIVKLADRLHNMTTINFLKIDKQKRIAKETFDVFANLAGRIGMYDLKTKLLDLSYAVLYPMEYKNTKLYIEKFIDKNQKKIDDFNLNLETLLKRNDINSKLITRIKGVYSTNKKMNTENIRLKDVYDIFATRIIIDGSQLECYKILGMVHLNFASLPKRFKDYISCPKLNLYQSLHTIIVYNGIYIELQIRNQEMDELSVYGLAAHWRYKEDKTTNSEVMDNIVKQVVSIQQNNNNDMDVKKISKNKFFDVLVLNNNKWYICNETQTILDIAFKANPQDFLSISSLVRDHKKVELNRLLKPGSLIEINYSSKIKATLDWLDWCTIHEAKEKINLYFLENQKENDNIIKDFLIIIKNKLKDDCATKDEITAKVISIGFNSLSDFINFLNENKISFTNIIVLNFCLNEKHGRKSATAFKKIQTFFLDSKKGLNFFFKELSGIVYKKIIYPKCCSKIPGIDCIGILEKWQLNVHNYSCTYYPKNKKEIVMYWDYEKLKNIDKIFNCNIIFEIPKNISNKIIYSIIDSGFTIVNLTTQKISDNKSIITTTINVRNLEQSQLIMDELKIKYSISKIELK